jgi:sortase (surface protein transpeptidase)
MAVMLGHTYVGNAFAVFNRLVEVHPGDEVSVADEAGVTRVNFRITHIVSGIPKGRPDALQQVLSANAQNSQLALITCGGEFNREYRASADNIIAFASLA